MKSATIAMTDNDEGGEWVRAFEQIHIALTCFRLVGLLFMRVRGMHAACIWLMFHIRSLEMGNNSQRGNNRTSRTYITRRFSTHVHVALLSRPTLYDQCMYYT